MDITFPALLSINDGVSSAFNQDLGAVGSRYAGFTMETTSTGAIEYYPRLNMLPGFRVWRGDRVVNNVSLATFQINNQLFESTIAIRRTDIEDDKLGLLTPAASQMGRNAGRVPDLLIAALLKAGHTTPIYDGQNFFDTAHPDFTAAGAAATSLNYVAGGGQPWYLFDTSQVLKPVIYQRRRPFVVIPKFSMIDPQVFWNQEFEWGADGRCNAGYGIWQYGYMSLAAPTVENILAARATMATYRRPDGSPMGVRGTLLVAGSSLYPQIKAIAEDEMIPNTFSNTFSSGNPTLYPNAARGMFTALEDEWLN
jgi:phage major head subunit gpT-like protein